MKGWDLGSINFTPSYPTDAAVEADGTGLAWDLIWNVGLQSFSPVSCAHINLGINRLITLGAGHGDPLPALDSG